MSKKKLLTLSLLSLIALGVIGAGVASAQGGWFGGWAQVDPAKFVERQNQMFGEQAALLGISADQVKEYWAQGKNMKEIAAELGISEEDLQAKMKQERENRVKEELQVLVANGVITQAQADARLQFMSNNSGKMMGGRLGHGRGGAGMGAGMMNNSGDCPCQNNQ